MLKTGIVLSVQKNKAHMVTSSGEFVKVKIKDSIPKVGETFSGELAKDFSFPKLPVAAASIVFLLLFSGTAFAYYTPASSVIVDINPSIMLKLNRFNRIIESSPLNKDGEKVLSEIKVKNKSINDALKTIVDEAKKDNFINENYVKSDKAVTVFVDSKSKKDIDLINFQKFMSETGVNLRINSNGRELKDTIENTSTENSKDKKSSSNQKDNDKQKNKDNQNKNNSATDNSDGNKESSNGSNSSNKNSSSDSNGKFNENNGGGKSEGKKNADNPKKTNDNNKSNGNSGTNSNNNSINDGNSHSNNGNGKNDKEKNKGKDKEKDKKESEH